jgi:hypothetical protein
MYSSSSRPSRSAKTKALIAIHNMYQVYPKSPIVEAPIVEAPIVEAPIVEAPIVEAPIQRKKLKKGVYLSTSNQLYHYKGVL